MPLEKAEKQIPIVIFHFFDASEKNDIVHQKKFHQKISSSIKLIIYIEKLSYDIELLLLFIFTSVNVYLVTSSITPFSFVISDNSLHTEKK